MLILNGKLYATCGHGSRSRGRGLGQARGGTATGHCGGVPEMSDDFDSDGSCSVAVRSSESAEQSADHCRALCRVCPQRAELSQKSQNCRSRYRLHGRTQQHLRNTKSKTRNGNAAYIQYIPARIRYEFLSRVLATKHNEPRAQPQATGRAYHGLTVGPRP